MTLAEQFAAALADLPEDTLFPDRLAAACAAVLPVDGAGLTFTFLPDRRLPVGSSDPLSRAAERLQFTLGEGPCLHAQQHRATTRATERDLQRTWPVYWTELAARTPYRSVVALPMLDHRTAFATLELYSRQPDTAATLDAALLADTTEVVDDWLIRGLVGDGDQHLGVPDWMTGAPVVTRRLVWQAVGYVATVDEVSTADALAVLRARAFARGGDVETTAQEVLAPT